MVFFAIGSYLAFPLPFFGTTEENVSLPLLEQCDLGPGCCLRLLMGRRFRLVNSFPAVDVMSEAGSGHGFQTTSHKTEGIVPR